MTLIALGLALGAVLGIIHLALLQANARQCVESGSWPRAALLYVLRFTGIGAAFWLIAQLGAAILIATLTGFVVARSVLLLRYVVSHG